MPRLGLYEHVRLLRTIGAAPAGAHGSIVLVGRDGYEVEVFDSDGETIDVVSASDEDLETAEPTHRAVA